MTEDRSRDSGASQPERLTIGQVVAPHGVRGEFRMYIYTQFPERIPHLTGVYFGDDDSFRRLRRARLKGNMAIMRVEGIDSREMAEELRDVPVRIDFEQGAPLEEGEHYHFEILDLEAYDESGTYLGTVVDIIETGANDVYVIRDAEGRETLVPALHDVVPEIDTEAGRMIVRPLRFYEGE